MAQAAISFSGFGPLMILRMMGRIGDQFTQLFDREPGILHSPLHQALQPPDRYAGSNDRRKPGRDQKIIEDVVVIAHRPASTISAKRSPFTIICMLHYNFLQFTFSPHCGVTQRWS
jgi:hypothetical protein